MADVCVDIFCGAGGFSHGFLDENTRFIGVDCDPVKLETYAYNIGGETICTDVLELDPSTLGNVKYLIGSPPCQPFSNANRFKTHDPRLIQRYIQIRDYLKPKWWVMEEVPGVAYVVDEHGNRLFQDWELRFQRASDHGLPHIRNRFYPGNYPDPVKHPYDGNFWVSSDGKHKTKYIPTVHTHGMNAFGYERQRGYPCSENLKKTIKATMIKTPVAQIRGYGHGKADRRGILEKACDLLDQEALLDDDNLRFADVITPEFCAMVMGFPSTYKFFGTKNEQFIQIGNAVCPPVARAIWDAIKSGRPAPKIQKTLW